jgi:hypothetical protein
MQAREFNHIDGLPFNVQMQLSARRERRQDLANHTRITLEHRLDALEILHGRRGWF